MQRRTMLKGMTAAAIAAAIPRPGLAADVRSVPSTGATVPAVGLGTWITFNVGKDPKLLKASAEVMQAFFEEGGGMIDSSPMYGSSQNTIGYGLETLGMPPVFAADKVWTSGADDGRDQIARSRAEWGVERFDLLQVHNLVDWKTHLKTLFAMKERGQLAHVGITTSHGRRHDEFERVMRDHPLDFVQLTYNIADRQAEERLLRLAADRGMAVIANRPFRRGALIRRLEGETLPGWAAEIGAESWPAFLLKFILSHPVRPIAIPATTRVDHVRENKAAARGPMPDAAMRRRMAEYVADL